MTDLARMLAVIGWTPATLATKTGLNERTVRRWANGQNRVPPPVMDFVTRLAKAHMASPPPEPPRRPAVAA